MNYDSRLLDSDYYTKTPLELKNENILKCSSISHRELAVIIDWALTELYSWLEGEPFKKTVMSNFYLIDISVVEDDFLKTFLLTYVKAISTIQDFLKMDIFCTNEIDNPTDFFNQFKLCHLKFPIMKGLCCITILEKKEENGGVDLLLDRLLVMDDILKFFNFLNSNFLETLSLETCLMCLEEMSKDHVSYKNHNLTFIGFDRRVSDSNHVPRLQGDGARAEMLTNFISNFSIIHSMLSDEDYKTSCWALMNNATCYSLKSQGRNVIGRVAFKKYFDSLTYPEEDNDKSVLDRFIEGIFKIEKTTNVNINIILSDQNEQFLNQIRIFLQRFFKSLFSVKDMRFIKLRSLVYDVHVFIEEEGNVMVHKNMVYLDSVGREGYNIAFPYKIFLIYLRNITTLTLIRVFFSDALGSTSDVIPILWVLSTKILPELQKCVASLILFLQNTPLDETLVDKMIKIFKNEGIYFHSLKLSCFGTFIILIHAVFSKTFVYEDSFVSKRMSFYHLFSQSIPVYVDYQFSSFENMQKEIDSLEASYKTKHVTLLEIGRFFIGKSKNLLSGLNRDHETSDMGRYRELVAKSLSSVEDLCKNKARLSEECPYIIESTTCLFVGINVN